MPNFTALFTKMLLPNGKCQFNFGANHIVEEKFYCHTHLHNFAHNSPHERVVGKVMQLCVASELLNCRVNLKMMTNKLIIEVMVYDFQLLLK